jgi:hypothetical protein
LNGVPALAFAAVSALNERVTADLGVVDRHPARLEDVAERVQRDLVG